MMAWSQTYCIGVGRKLAWVPVLQKQLLALVKTCSEGVGEADQHVAVEISLRLESRQDLPADQRLVFLLCRQHPLKVPAIGSAQEGSDAEVLPVLP